MRINERPYYLTQQPCCSGLNKHRQWFDEINDISIFSNDDMLGNKFYMTEGELPNTRYYASPSEAALTYHLWGEKAKTID